MKLNFFTMKYKISFLPQLIKRGSLFIFIVCGFLISTSISAQLPTAKQIASKMRMGWNLGNTLEATWATPGNASQRLIDSVKAAGFNSVRLPCAWFNNSDTITSIIKPAYLAQVKQNVDYCIKDSMYVMINIHWDKGWLENRVTVADSAIVNARQKKYWTQIANYFKDYDEHLLFACANEPDNSDLKAGGTVMESYIQTFIKAVRGTGGNNASRTLIYQGHPDYSTIPQDEIADRLMFEAHSYGYQFALLEKDMLNPWCGGCGDTLYCIYYWGKGNHSLTDLKHNPQPPYDEEADIDKFFGTTLKSRFVDKGVPVILGEYGAWKRGTLAYGADRALHNKSVEYYHYYMIKSALKNGAIPFIWDTGSLFDRSTGVVPDWGIVGAMNKGAKEAEEEGAPGFIQASVTDTNPKQIQVVLSASVVKENSFTGFTLKIDSNVATMDSVVLLDTNKVVIHISQSILKTNTITLSYNNGNVFGTSNGKKLIKFTDKPVDNQLKGSSPQIIEVTTDINGGVLIMKFNKKMQLPSDVSALALNAEYNGQMTIPFLQGSFFNNDSTTLSFSLDTLVYRDYTLSISYTGSNFASADSGLLAAVSNFPVTNVSNGLPVHIVSGKIEANGIALSLEFSKAMALTAVQSGYFVLAVNGNSVAFSSYIVSNKTIQLTLSKYVHVGDSVKISYTPGDIKASDKGPLEAIIDFAINNQVAPVWVAIPVKLEAENFIFKSGGLKAETTGDAGGGQNIGYIGDGNWLEYTIENKTSEANYQISFRVAAQSTGGIIDYYIDDMFAGRVTTPSTGGWQVYQSVVKDISITQGKHYLKVVATKAGFNFNYMVFTKTLTGIENVTATNTVIYPNPVSNEMIVSSGGFQHNKIEIFDAMGKIVTSIITAGEPVLHVPVDLSNGIYFVKISNEMQYQLKKIMVTNK
jgi:hypothetical protein